MIKKGQTVHLETKDAIYSPCKVMEISKMSITVRYFAGMKRDKSTGGFFEEYRVETLNMKNVTHLS